VVGPVFVPSKRIKNKPDLFEPPLIPLLRKEGIHYVIKFTLN